MLSDYEVKGELKTPFTKGGVFAVEKNGKEYILKKSPSKNEIDILQKLSSYSFFPMVIEFGQDYLITAKMPGKTLYEYSGGKQKFFEIYAKAYKIIIGIKDGGGNFFNHGDFCPVNIIVYEDKIFFVDFEKSYFARRNDDLETVRQIIEKHYGKGAYDEFMREYL